MAESMEDVLTSASLVTEYFLFSEMFRRSMGIDRGLRQLYHWDLPKR